MISSKHTQKVFIYSLIKKTKSVYFFGGSNSMKSNYKNIFSPLTIKNMTMKNRIMMTPMGTNYGEQTGEMSFLHINYYEERAKGGVGLIMVENASVDSPLGSNGTTQIRID